MTESTNNSRNQDQKFHVHTTWLERVEIIAHWVVMLWAIPISFICAILGQFLQRGGSGTRILGGFAFWIGTLFSTDGIWQTFFQGVPIFPWFENNWIGWKAWLTLPFNPLFVISLVISYLIQTQEAKTLRSKSPAVAKQQFEEAAAYTLPQEPKNTIDLARSLWRDYKRAGMKERNGNGLAALFFWGLDFVTTFVGRNPWRYTNPGMIIACLAYNVFTMLAGELGYDIWKHSKKQ
jgi:hypothetical protein